MPKAKKTIPTTEQEITERALHFCFELHNQLSEMKQYVESETQRVRETRELITAYDSRSSSVGLVCILDAAEDTDWYGMAGLTRALLTSMDRHDSQSLENFLEHEAKESQRKREKREASKQRRLEKEAALPSEPSPK